jgi:hypothetical protein
MMAQIWTATKFLAGSTSKRIPYEIAYCLKTALASWTHKKALITTALTQDKDYSFYFQGIPPEFYTLAGAYAGVTFESELVQIALPQIYQHRPLLNVALYHELGHFLDIHHGIVNHSLLLMPSDKLPLPGINFSNFTSAQRDTIAIYHRREYFADIFAANYIGKAIREFLREFAGNNPTSITHPATKDRLEQIDSFLSGTNTEIINLFQESLTRLGLNKLKIAFSVPNVSTAFDNVRPYTIRSEAELHGIYEAGINYLRQVLANPSSPWLEAGENSSERIVNNLVEKSIRNWMIIDRWRNSESTAQ